jgi:AhpD family alkylhydroperoxidase
LADSRFMKRLYRAGDYYRILSDLITRMGDMSTAHRSGHVSKPFMERIMMAVTEVNGCRYCSYFHSRVALKAGLEKGEIKRTLAGDFGMAPEEELAALYFAQHYAESAGQPQPEALQCLVDIYGEAKARDILAFIRAIMVGNAWGNMFDSLRMRLKGKPSDGIRLWDELLAVIGTSILIPMILIQGLFQPLWRAIRQTA